MASLCFVFLSFCLFTKPYLQYVYAYVCQQLYSSLLSVVCAQWVEDAVGLWKAFTPGDSVCVCVWNAYFRTFSLVDFDAVLKRGLLAKNGSWVKFTVACAS